MAARGSSTRILGQAVCLTEAPGKAGLKANNPWEDPLGIGTSIFLFAVGAILRYAVTASVSGIDLDVVGLILMIAGAVGLVLSLLWMTIWADRTRGGRAVERDVVDRPVVRERDVY
jgi:Domain of unknown function (DUF6458)